MIISLAPGFAGRKNKLFRIVAKLRALLAHGRFKENDTPVIINNYNRLGWLKLQIAWLEKADVKNIYIIDNASTYPPLLDYYKQCPYIVFRLTENVGHTAFWDSHIHLWFKNRYYILTDPDVVPVAECPYNVIGYFYELLLKYQDITKVGFGLKIDDIPLHYNRRDEVIKWEEKFWTEEVEKDVYKADIDTTFALYRPNSRHQQWGTTLRTAGNYLARHLPWYEDSENPDEEEFFFRNTASHSSSWYKEGEYKG